MHDAAGPEGRGLMDAGAGAAESERPGNGRDLWYADRATRLAAARDALAGIEAAHRDPARRPPVPPLVREHGPSACGHDELPQPVPYGLTPGDDAADPPRTLPDRRVPERAGLATLEYAVVDVETTGGSGAFGHRVTEVGIVCVSGTGEFRGELRSLVNPRRPIPAAVRRLTRISQAMVDAAPLFAEVAEAIQAVLRGRVLVAHNAGFDWRFLRGELELCRRRVPSRARLCTVRMARRLVPEVRSRSLDALCRYFGIPNEARHRAWGDARATAALLIRLIERAEERAAPTLEDLRVLLRPAGPRPRRRSALPRSMEWA